MVKARTSGLTKPLKPFRVLVTPLLATYENIVSRLCYKITAPSFLQARNTSRLAPAEVLFEK